jgi:hydrogenase maturation protein HypF
MAASYLDLAFAGDVPARLPIRQRHEEAWGPVAALARAGRASALTSSAGRLFDAVSAIVCGRDTVNYEGQAAVELEQLADPRERSSYPVPLEDAGGSGQFRVMVGGLVRLVVQDVENATEPAVVAARFHNALADALVAACRRARELSGLATVALSGGVFQNLLLTERTAAGLEEAGFSVLLHSRVPTNDGGISLGQAAIAGARDANG